MATVEITITTSPTLLGTVAAGQTFVAQVTGTTGPVFVSDETTSANLTTANGIELAAASSTAPGGDYTLTYHPGPGQPQTLSIYGIVASSTCTVVAEVVP